MAKIRCECGYEAVVRELVFKAVYTCPLCGRKVQIESKAPSAPEPPWTKKNTDYVVKR